MLRPPALITLVLLLSACDGDPNPKDQESDIEADEDDDGYLAPEDCDDNNEDISPEAPEICDGIDNNCDGGVDEGLISTAYADADGDGYGNPLDSIEDCEIPEGYIAQAGDCDDSNPAISPDIPEFCDRIDNNCDGSVDEGLSTLSYADTDGDGFGNTMETTEDCGIPDGYVLQDGDCDDTQATVYPNALEVCDGLDNNCDGDTDPDTSVDAVMWYADDDHDGYGTTYTISCTQPADSAAVGGDCDDRNPAIRPYAIESCNAVDDDCDGWVDEDLPINTYYLDGDGDSWGDETLGVAACAAPTGFVVDAGDCNDNDAAISPVASELCDGLDNNCDSRIDEAGALDERTWYADADADGHGNPNVSLITCNAPTDYVAAGDDCNDNDAAISPVATELCDGIDNNCDSFIDEAGALDERTWYADADADGHGNPSASILTCNAPADYVATGDDCDDTHSAIFPGSTELCDGIDNNCDGHIDEAGAYNESTWYADTDTDGYGDPSVSIRACNAPAHYIATADDCNDSNPAISPMATEICNNMDDDCDGVVDDGITYLTSALDADLDGYGDAAHTVIGCTIPTGYVSDTTDCNDANIAVNPAATEVCDNGIDDNCDGIAERGGLLNVPSNYATIQAAVNMACDGASIDVAPGTYTETVNLLGKELHITGTGGSTTTIVNGGGSGPIFDTTGTHNTTLDGFTLTHGSNALSGGIVANATTGLELSDIVVTASSGAGGALYVSAGSTVSVVDSEFTGNSAPGGAYQEGGAIFNAGTLTLDTVVISANTFGGGGYWAAGGIYSMGFLDMRNSSITDNVAGGGSYWTAGGMYATGTVQMTGCAILRNTTTNGSSAGGLYLGSGTAISTQTDWGSSSNNNTPNDVYIHGGSTYTTFGTASFTCSTSSTLCQ